MASSSASLTVPLADERPLKPVVGFQSSSSPSSFRGLSSGSDTEAADILESGASTTTHKSKTASTANQASTRHLLDVAGRAQQAHAHEKAQAAILSAAKGRAAKAFAVAEAELQLAEQKHNAAAEALQAAQEAYEEQAKREADALRKAEQTKVVPVRYA